MFSTAVIALAASLSTASAAGAIQGFNYGSTFTDGSAKSSSDFQAEFNAAKNLAGTSGWTSARLYTTIQAGTANTPISAIDAAIQSDTTLLLGMWASAGQDAFNNELAALKAAIGTYGDKLTQQIVGISVGSEDLYRITPTGIAAKSGAGAGPNDLVNYVSQLRAAIKDGPLSKVPIGHVDTWTAWVNGSNAAVISSVDWLGVDAYPYFQSSMPNAIDAGASLFQQAFDNTAGVAAGKPVWITETGWPVSGPEQGAAVPSVQNAQTYWEAVACPRIGNVNLYWYTLQDAAPATPSPSFGILGSNLNSAPLYDLTCSAQNMTSTVGAPGSTTSSTSSPGSTSGSTSGSGSTTGGTGSPGTSSGSGNGTGTGSAPGSTVTSTSGNGGSPSGLVTPQPSSVSTAGGAIAMTSVGGIVGALLAVLAAF